MNNFYIKLYAPEREGEMIIDSLERVLQEEAIKNVFPTDLRSENFPPNYNSLKIRPFFEIFVDGDVDPKYRGTPFNIPKDVDLEIKKIAFFIKLY